MRIGIIAFNGEGSHLRYGDEKYRRVREHGFDCVDFGLEKTESVYYTLPEAESDALLRRERELAAEAGVTIAQVHGPWRYPPRDGTAEDRAERMEKMKRSIRMAALLGCPYWVVHPIMPFGTEDAGTPNAALTWEMNLTFMRELLPTAKEYGVTVCLENMPMRNFSMAKPADILRFVREIGDEYFKICLDTGHVSTFDDQGLTAGNAVRELRDELRCLHVHDNRYLRDMHLFPFEGIIDWEDFGRALGEIGYQGVFSIETEPPKKLPDPLFSDMAKFLARLGELIVSYGDEVRRGG